MCLYLDFLFVYFKSLHLVKIRIHLRMSEIGEFGAKILIYLSGTFCVVLGVCTSW